jgi:hypothetical protein
MNRPRLAVEVVWTDAASANASWKPLADLRPATVTIHSVGYLLEVTPRYVTLLQNAGDNGRAADTITVPRPCVRSMRRLR